MTIKILSPLIHKGKETGLYNYQWVLSDGSTISAVFQATIEKIERLKKGTK